MLKLELNGLAGRAAVELLDAEVELLDGVAEVELLNRNAAVAEFPDARRDVELLDAVAEVELLDRDAAALVLCSRTAGEVIPYAKEFAVGFTRLADEFTEVPGAPASFHSVIPFAPMVIRRPAPGMLYVPDSFPRRPRRRQRPESATSSPSSSDPGGAPLNRIL